MLGPCVISGPYEVHDRSEPQMAYGRQKLNGEFSFEIKAKRYKSNNTEITTRDSCTYEIVFGGQV